MQIEVKGDIIPAKLKGVSQLNHGGTCLRVDVPKEHWLALIALAFKSEFAILHNTGYTILDDQPVYVAKHNIGEYQLICVNSIPLFDGIQDYEPKED